jgi:uncharacterized iron-regulated membrane protein
MMLVALCFLVALLIATAALLWFVRRRSPSRLAHPAPGMSMRDTLERRVREGRL